MKLKTILQNISFRKCQANPMGNNNRINLQNRIIHLFIYKQFFFLAFDQSIAPVYIHSYNRDHKIQQCTTARNIDKIFICGRLGNIIFIDISFIIEWSNATVWNRYRIDLSIYYGKDGRRQRRALLSNVM